MTSTPPELEPKAARPNKTGSSSLLRKLRIALAVSVAVNLAVVGLVVGTALRHGEGPMGRSNVRDLGFGIYSQILNREEKEALRAAFLAEAPDLRAKRRAMRQDALDVVAALRADPFDADRLSEVLAVQGQRLSEQLSVGGRLIGAFLIEMAPEARRAFADRLEASLKRPKKP